jgi:hypothetical protein
MPARQAKEHVVVGARNVGAATTQAAAPAILASQIAMLKEWNGRPTLVPAKTHKRNQSIISDDEEPATRRYFALNPFCFALIRTAAMGL